MKPLYPLRETGLVDAHEDWVGRTVLDAYYRAFGQIADLLVEERSIEDAAREDGDPRAWTVRPVYAIVRLGTNWLSRRLNRQVILPVDELVEEGDALKTTEDRDSVVQKLAA